VMGMVFWSRDSIGPNIQCGFGGIGEGCWGDAEDGIVADMKVEMGNF
jgi:hypothetical protein